MGLDEESCDVLRKFTKLKLSLLPYLAYGSKQVSEEGIPLMRPMALEFPHDPAAEYLDRQYMLGDDLLVAPVFSPDGVVRYYVPEGTWTNVLNGERIAGPRWIEEQFDYMTMPLLARPGAVIPMQEGRCDTDGDLTDDVILKIYDPAALDSEWRQLVLRHGLRKMPLRRSSGFGVRMMCLKCAAIPWKTDGLSNVAVSGFKRMPEPQHCRCNDPIVCASIVDAE